MSRWRLRSVCSGRSNPALMLHLPPAPPAPTPGCNELDGQGEEEKADISALSRIITDKYETPQCPDVVGDLIRNIRASYPGCFRGVSF